mmetsp:Transcript_100493/g.260011  ORF Transcript_100493/g.260011 Transcript_100493/m.260011 type:complete len:259 (-) Transcript_100493:188-964(-)|eukprot:CAMPEP_0115377894 /NCGR_PEP_ID=MMETSP0271-20121206/3731_1 /TAXON_ID=71861 /ORGANISM="Scrippsiella trochoidea, Strain CCMP3099" /LENGTH=258 /DNA_ID=CAMNT_0002801039 /DNA_START=1 /DNA_END=777 /DNA_ORIENTATION=+
MDQAGEKLADVSATEVAPECPICMGFLCEPLTVACGHAFCRVCLLESTRLSPSGRLCPLCRAAVDIKNPMTHGVDTELENQVLKLIPKDEYDARQRCGRERLDELQKLADTQLPIFFMYPGSAVGAPVALHFFEPRYKILIRRAWEGSRLFVFCARKPRRGEQGIVVRVSQAQFLPDGRANIVGRGVEAITLGDVWVEDGTGGLFYTRRADGSSGTTSSGGDTGSTPEASDASQADSRRWNQGGVPRCPGPRCGCAIL